MTRYGEFFPDAVPLDAVLKTYELPKRASRPPDLEAESRAIAKLVQQLSVRPEDLLQTLVEAVLQTCRADSAGVSILESEQPSAGATASEDGAVLRWHAIAGALADKIGGSMPRDDSPCGTVIDRNEPLLFDRPARHFRTLADIEPPITEALLLPFHVEGRPIGTVWALSHTPQRRFDAEDARLLESLSRFASAGYQLATSLHVARLDRDELEQRVQSRTLELTRLTEALKHEIGERKQAQRTLQYHKDQAETLINQAPLGVYLVDADFRILQVNPVALPAFGEIADDFVGRDFESVMHALWGERYADEVVRIFRHTLESGESYHMPERAERRLDRGVVEYYEWRTDRVTLPDGRYGVVCYFRDVSEQVQARLAVAASEHRYRTLFNSIDEGFTVIDMQFNGDGEPVDWIVLEGNPAFNKQLGLKDAVGKRARELVPDLEAHWFEIYGKVATTGEPVRFVEQSQALGGRWFDVYAFRLGGPESRRVGVLLRNITERRNADIALHEAHAKLQKQASRLQALATELTRVEHRERKRLAAVLHDHLQQLLVAARMRLTRFRQAPRDGVVLVEQAIELIDEALEASRNLTQQLRPPVLYEAGLVPALQWLGAQMQRHHGLRVRVEADAFDASRAGFDDDLNMLLFDCVRELLFNAAKHAGAGEATVAITEEEACLRITVSDPGQGFDLDAVLDRSRARTFGLFSIRERLAALGGKMDVTSEAGNGTCIDLHVPWPSHRQRPTGTPEDTCEAEAPADVEQDGDAEAGGIAVLVVDDHRIVREGIVNVLAGDPRLRIMGEAADGHEAIRVIERHQPDVVVMDVNMPRMNGVETTRVVHGRWPNLPVIGLSVQEDEATVRAMREAGAAAFIPKSGDFDRMVQTIVDVATRTGKKQS